MNSIIYEYAYVRFYTYFILLVTGEYISLYHHQRALLQQRETHKNDYISQLARDREELQVNTQQGDTRVFFLLKINVIFSLQLYRDTSPHIYIFFALTLNESVIFDALQFPMQNIYQSRDLSCANRRSNVIASQ